MKSDAFQFSIGRMLALTAVCAGVATLANLVGGPGFWRGTIALLLILMAAYIALRVPYLYRQIRKSIRDWQRIRRQQVELNAGALARKRKIQEARERADR